MFARWHQAQLLCLIGIAIWLSACSTGGEYGQRPSKDQNAAQQAPISETVFLCEAKGSGGTEAIDNFFPWPPPRGSDEQEITESVLRTIRRTQRTPVRLGDVDRFVRNRLASVGLKPSAYFSTPGHDGYATVARLEQIDEDGRRLEGRPGFSKDPDESGNFLLRFLKGLISLPEGRFRLLMFFVTPDRIDRSHSTQEVTLKDADRWVNGCNGLPPELAALILTPRHKVFLRVYEFVSKGIASRLVTSADGALPLAQHLAALKLNLDN
jgi:hypothetical protein